MQKYNQPHPDRPWAIIYTVEATPHVMGRYSSRPDAETTIAKMKRLIDYPMAIIWDGKIEALATGGR
jgi:hypothetical protein